MSPRSTNSHGRSLAVSCALVVSSSAIALLVLELALRVAVARDAFLDPLDDAFWMARFARTPPSLDTEDDPDLGWRMKRLFSRPGITHDRLGFRARAEGAEVTKGGARRRLLVLGDSFTYGLGVRDEETYAFRLQAIFPEHEVINAGVNGYGIDQALLMWRKEGSRLRPDVVVLGYFVDDFNRNALSFREFAKPRFVLGEGRLELIGTPVPGRDELTNVAQRLASRPRFVEAIEHAFRRAKRVDPRFEKKVRLNRQILLEFRDELERTGTGGGDRTRLLVAFIPHCEYHRYPHFDEIARAVADACRELGIPWIDLTDALESRDRDPVPLYGSHCHWSPEGHRLAAALIADRLIAW